ncbi:flagellar basal body L-ring protein FlgH [Azospira oryzae]|jgi:flagellar L-ring protein precursor FlgH|uniref:flagellar basal body L-ring protein FlgH n=1 Tax=Azospira oryzae TaxID=146939 RepID=UPI0019640C29|nr:flagellar basal body L-ring protein FlgH [Azospira oryzae]
MKLSLPLIIGLLTLLSGCASVPPTNVHQPMTARPQPRNDLATNNGGIFMQTASRPLFEDRRARFVGDTIVVNIVENTQASIKGNTSAEKTGAINASVTALAGVPGKSFQGLNAQTSSSNTFDGKGESGSSNVFTGTMTATVIEVLPNGNLLVSGEKQVAIGQGQEFVRVSGVVNPYMITAANAVNSSQMADARIEYKSSGIINEAQVMGWLARFFLTFIPF